MRYGLLLLGLIAIAGLWLWDRPDRNPFQVARVYRLLTYLLLLLTCLLSYKVFEWNRALRALILDTCR